MEEQKFPENRVEYLTIRYMDTLDLTGLTPEQIVDKYLEVKQAIISRFTEHQFPGSKEI